jgi:hypothetical protein
MQQVCLRFGLIENTEECWRLSNVIRVFHFGFMVPLGIGLHQLADVLFDSAQGIGGA